MSLCRKIRRRCISASDNEMIQALAPDRSDQPFQRSHSAKARLVRWARPGCHGTQTAREEGVEHATPMATKIGDPKAELDHPAMNARDSREASRSSRASTDEI